jgi:sugar phosphate isomerase/epimerase
VKLNYNLSSWSFEAYSTPTALEDAADEARNAGYGIELWPMWRGESNLFSPENRERIVGLLNGMPSSLHSGFVKTLAEHKVQIDTASAAGSKVIVVHSDSIGVQGPDADFGLAQSVVDYAQANGVTIALENGVHEGSLDCLVKALDKIDALKACLDIGHAFCAHDYPLKDYLGRIGERLAHLHLQDVYMVPGTRQAIDDSHRPPGKCEILPAEWQTLFASLAKIDFEGSAVLEVRPFTPVEVANQSVEFFKSVGAQ